MRCNARPMMIKFFFFLKKKLINKEFHKSAQVNFSNFTTAACGSSGFKA